MSNPLGEITASPPEDQPFDGKKESTTVDSKPKKKCALKDVLPESVVALVKAAPNNETIRSLMLAHLRVSVPKEEDDFDKVKKWIEYNVEPPPRQKTAAELQQERYEEDYRRQQAAEEERRRTQVMLQVSASEREHGRCSYYKDLRGEGEMPLQRAVLINIASEAGNEAEFFDRIEEFLDQEGPDNYISMNTVENTESHDDHETDEITDSSVTLKDAAKTALKEALRNADPALYESLFE